MKFSDIPKFTRPANYRINVSWDYFPNLIDKWTNEWKGDSEGNLNLNPEFQRGHVWTRKQQIAYVEFKLRGGYGANDILFNCVGWMGKFEGPFVLVDGKQRIEAVFQFLNNKLKVFEKYYRKDFEGRISSDTDFIFHVNDLKTEEEVLNWYLELNSGGTPHTKAELDKVKKMLQKISKEKNQQNLKIEK